MSLSWKPRGQTYSEALEYMKGRRAGEITSLKTRWEKFNSAGVDGIEWQSTVILCGRPGSLKSALKDHIVRDAFECNPNENFRVLDFQFEMIGRVTALRELSSAVKKSYKHLCSADGQITRELYLECKKYGEEKGDSTKYPVDVVEDACTVERFGQIIDEYMETHKQADGKYTKTLITVDHSILFEFDKDEFNLNDLLMKLGRTLTKKKRKYPIIFIILSQLNRNIEQPGRNDNKKYGNYVLSSDLYGSDLLLMHADMVIGLDRPALRNIQYFGPPGFIISSEQELVMHWIKCRNGSGQLSFFKVDFESMTVEETPPLPTVKAVGN